MTKNLKIAAVIPCYKGGKVTLEVIRETLEFVDRVILVDDACPYETGKLAKKNFSDERIIVLFNEYNLGVGGSIKRAFKYLIETDFDIFIKIDADGQMDPKEIPKLLNPIINGKADVTKGNRFFNIEKLSSMPKVRLIGNLFISFFARAATGYWELFDSNNGFIAIDKKILKTINLNKLDDHYYFETDLLFRLGLSDAIIFQVPTEVRYDTEESSLKPIREIKHFSIKLLISFLKRIFYQYFLFDFNVGSIELILTLILGISALIWNLYAIISGMVLERLSSPGTTAISIILTISAIQFMLAFINYDVNQRVIIKRLKLLRDY